jgi:hypothetical protein
MHLASTRRQCTPEKDGYKDCKIDGLGVDWEALMRKLVDGIGFVSGDIIMNSREKRALSLSMVH